MDRQEILNRAQDREFIFAIVRSHLEQSKDEGDVYFGVIFKKFFLRIDQNNLPKGFRDIVASVIVHTLGKIEADGLISLYNETASLTTRGWTRQFKFAEQVKTDAGGSLNILSMQIPASDRFVDLTDNAGASSNIALAAEALETATREANQLTPEADSDDALRRETAGIRAMLSGKRVMAGLLVVLRACVERIKMVAARVQAKAVEAAADRLFAALTDFLQGLGLL
ncbi:MAG: hypothetical protein NTW56_14015 [Alphaproteobacteria bacterium]|nr:hypothetical protein [Alphaproteobacteria bacterium]